MNNQNRWEPGKYAFDRHGRFGPRLGADGIAPESWLNGALVAAAYSQALASRCEGQILDLGCGSAPLYPLYKDRASFVVLADWPNSLHPSPCLDCHLDLARPLPFANDAFDLVILSDVLEHLPRPGAVMKEIHRITVPGGRVLLNVPFLYGLHEVPHDYFRYTEYGLRHLAVSAGFKIDAIRPLGGGWESLVNLVSKMFHNLPGATAPLLALQKLAFCWLRHRGSWARTLPLGYFVELEKE